MSHMIKAKLKIMFEDLDLLHETLDELNIKHTRTNENVVNSISYFQAKNMLKLYGYQKYKQISNGNVITLDEHLRTYIDNNGNIHYDDMYDINKLQKTLKEIGKLYTVKNIEKNLKKKNMHKKYNILREKQDNKYVLKLVQK